MEPAVFRLVAQCLNQLQHRHPTAPCTPTYRFNIRYLSNITSKFACCHASKRWPAKSALYTVYSHVCRLHVRSQNCSLTVASSQGSKETLQIPATFPFCVIHTVTLSGDVYPFYVRLQNCEKRLSFTSCLSDRPSVRMDQLRSHWMDFHWKLIFVYFSKFCRENSNLIQIGNEQRALYMKTSTQFWSHLAQFFTERNIFQKKNVVQKLKTHAVCPITFFSKPCHFEIMRKNTAKRGRPQMTIWRMRVACWIPKATHKHTRICNKLCSSTATMDTRTHLNGTL